MNNFAKTIDNVLESIKQLTLVFITLKEKGLITDAEIQETYNKLKGEQDNKQPEVQSDEAGDTSNTE